MSDVQTTRKIETRSGDSTREILIEAYLTLCARVGAENVTIEKIAKESGYSFGTVRYHFAGENADITQSAILYVLKKGIVYLQDQLTLAKGQPGYDPVGAYVSANFSWLYRYQAHARFLLYFYYLCSIELNLIMKNQEFLKASRTRIDDLLFEGIGRGLYPSAKNLGTLSTQIHDIVIGSCLASMIGGASAENNVHEKTARETIAHLIQSKLAVTAH